MVETRKNRQLKFYGTRFYSYKQLIQLKAHSFRPMRWTSKTLFPIQLVGKPHPDTTGELVCLIHYVGFHNKYDEVRPLRDLVAIPGNFFTHFIYFFTLKVRVRWSGGACLSIHRNLSEKSTVTQ